MYTPWCDEDGKVIDDGTVQRISDQKFRITSAEPNLEWLEYNAIGLNLEIKDDSTSTAALALQGPNSKRLLEKITDADLDSLEYYSY